MNRIIFPAAFAVMLAGCTPQGEALTLQAINACKRADVQDVVGKEARNLMLKANEDGLWRAALFGVNVAAAVEQARVSFGEVGVYTDTAQSPYTQIVCTSSMQIDGSSAQAGQDIVTIPHLRWSINFAEPTQDPETASFSIAVDPASLYDGILVNGEPAQAKSQKPATEIDSDQAEQPAAPPADEAVNPGDAAAEAAADAEAAAHAGEDIPPVNHQPSDEELYAPHSN